jgi:hypothetical protein
MSRRRRITALVMGLLLLPSTASGGGAAGCVMLFGADPAAATSTDPVHAAHVVEAHPAHESPAAVIADDVDDDGSPPSRSHVPAECLSAATCASLALSVSSALTDAALRRSTGVTAESPRVPLSPSIGLEPPPPRD